MASKSQLLSAANAALRAKRWAEAEHWLCAVRQLAPTDTDSLYNLGLAVHAQGRTQDAILVWKQVLAIDPRNVATLSNLGTVLFQLGHEREGLRYTITAVDLAPTNMTLLTNVAVAWIQVGDYQGALKALEKALTLQPGRPSLLLMKLECLGNLSRHVESRELALQLLASADPLVYSGALCVLMEAAAYLSDWEVLSTYHQQWEKSALVPGASYTPPMLMFATDDPTLLFDVGALLGETNCVSRPPYLRRTDRVTIGYISGDFSDHPVAHMLLEVVARHDRARFRVVLISAKTVDASPVAQRLRAQADGLIDIADADTETAHHLIRDGGVDVLVDLSGMTRGHRVQVLKTRPCPAQILWLGCPATTGMKHYDAFIVDHTVAPPGFEAFCHEPLARLPCCYHPISASSDVSSAPLQRADLNLPATGVLVGMLQLANRLRPPFIYEVVAILARHPTAYLLLRTAPAAQAQVLALLARHGLPAERVVFVPRFERRGDYLRVVELLDLVIDTHPYGGHSTSGEAIALGTPVLTRCGASIYSRVAASMLSEVGLGDVVTHSSAHWAETLEALLADPLRLQEWKRRFSLVRPEHLDHINGRLTAALEATYLDILRHAETSLPPAPPFAGNAPTS